MKRALVWLAAATCAVSILALAAAQSAQPARRPGFVDVAPQSRISYVTNNGFTGRKYFPQPLCGGVAVLDYDNDGWMDIFFTNGASFPSMRKTESSFYNTLLRNKRDGTFEDVSRRSGLAGEPLGYSLGAAAGDFDNDGWTDLFVANAGAIRSTVTTAMELFVTLPPRRAWQRSRPDC